MEIAMSDIDDDIEADVLDIDGSISYDDETIVWHGKPSQWVNLGTFIFWAIAWFIPVIIYYYWNYNGFNTLYFKYESFYNSTLFLSSISPPLMMVWAWLDIFYTETVVTKNRITEYRGITEYFREGQNCEISDIEDIMSPPAGLLSFVGCASLVLITKDMNQPVIEIRAIKDREELRDKLTPIWRKLRLERKGFF